jgi:hypothetical protein
LSQRQRLGNLPGDGDGQQHHPDQLQETSHFVDHALLCIPENENELPVSSNLRTESPPASKLLSNPLAAQLDAPASSRTKAQS